MSCTEYLYFSILNFYWIGRNYEKKCNKKRVILTSMRMKRCLWTGWKIDSIKNVTGEWELFFHHDNQQKLFYIYCTLYRGAGESWSIATQAQAGLLFTKQ